MKSASRKTSSSGDEKWMLRAIRLARKGTPSPNPRVGAVIVRNDRLLGEGYHRRAGGKHAEIAALDDAGGSVRGATLYVTLEPCPHHGRTPPCTEAIIRAGIKKVVVGMKDPDPKVRGRGIGRLKKGRIVVVQGVLQSRCESLLEEYCVHRIQGRPFVTLKAAISLDGRIATKTGDSKWITGEKARKKAHRLRAENDAVLVGSGTVMADDPRLTVRNVRGRDPVRVILNSTLSIPLSSRIIRHESDAPTLIFHTSKSGSSEKAFAGIPGVQTIRMPAKRNRGVDLKALLSWLGEHDILSLMVEGGAEVHYSFLDAGLVDRLDLFVAPKIIGGTGAVPMVGGEGISRVSRAWNIDNVKTRRLDADLWIRGRIKR